MQTKSEIRGWVKQQHRALPPREAAQMATALFERIEQLPHFCHAQQLLLFHSLPDEVSTHAFITRWATRKQLYLPVVCGDSLEVRHYNPEALTHGAYGIVEPTTTPIASLDLLDLIIVPGVAFDPHCNRLGRGKGYYDRLLKQTTAYTVGIGYNFQLLPQLPTEPHDVPLDAVIVPHATIIQRT